LLRRSHALQIVAAPQSGIDDELNRQLNQVMDGPFRAASGTAD
jgi:hypothetical protein